MADIHVLPVRTENNDMSQITSLLANAFAEGVDLGPRSHHIKAIALTVEEQLESLRQMLDAFGKSPEARIVNLDHLQDLVMQLNKDMSRLSYLAKKLNG